MTTPTISGNTFVPTGEMSTDLFGHGADVATTTGDGVAGRGTDPDVSPFGSGDGEWTFGSGSGSPFAPDAGSVFGESGDESLGFGTLSFGADTTSDAGDVGFPTDFGFAPSSDGDEGHLAQLTLTPGTGQRSGNSAIVPTGGQFGGSRSTAPTGTGGSTGTSGSSGVDGTGTVIRQGLESDDAQANHYRALDQFFFEAFGDNPGVQRIGDVTRRDYYFWRETTLSNGEGLTSVEQGRFADVQRAMEKVFTEETEEENGDFFGEPLDEPLFAPSPDEEPSEGGAGPVTAGAEGPDATGEPEGTEETGDADGADATGRSGAGGEGAGGLSGDDQLELESEASTYGVRDEFLQKAKKGVFDGQSLAEARRRMFGEELDAVEEELARLDQGQPDYASTREKKETLERLWSDALGEERLEGRVERLGADIVGEVDAHMDYFFPNASEDYRRVVDDLLAGGKPLKDVKVDISIDAADAASSNDGGDPRVESPHPSPEEARSYVDWNTNYVEQTASLNGSPEDRAMFDAALAESSGKTIEDVAALTAELEGLGLSSGQIDKVKLSVQLGQVDFDDAVAEGVHVANYSSLDLEELDAVLYIRPRIGEAYTREIIDDMAAGRYEAREAVSVVVDVENGEYSIENGLEGLRARTSDEFGDDASHEGTDDSDPQSFLPSDGDFEPILDGDAFAGVDLEFDLTA